MIQENDLPPLIDLHQDIGFFIMTNPRFKDFDKEDKNRPGDIPTFKKINLKIICAAIFPMTKTLNEREYKRMKGVYGRGWDRIDVVIPGGTFTNTINMIKLYYNLERYYSENIEIIFEKKKLENILNNEKIELLLSLEGAEALYEPTDIDIIYNLGIKIIGLTWNFDNKYASSCASKKDYGLTGYGETLVDYANEKGIIIDLAHSSKKTMLETMRCSRLPLIISHANYLKLKNHVRNVDDEVLESLYQNNGVIGFTLIKGTIGGKDYIKNLAKHIITVYQSYGDKIIALGTDYFGTAPPKGLEKISKLKVLYSKLLEMGMNNNDLKKFTWKNAYRVIKINSKNWK